MVDNNRVIIDSNEADIEQVLGTFAGRIENAVSLNDVKAAAAKLQKELASRKRWRDRKRRNNN